MKAVRSFENLSKLNLVKSSSCDNLGLLVLKKSKSNDNVKSSLCQQQQHPPILPARNFKKKMNTKTTTTNTVFIKNIINVNTIYNEIYSAYYMIISLFNINDIIPLFISHIMFCKDNSESIRNIYRMIVKNNIMQSKRKIIIVLKTSLVIYKLWAILFSVQLDYPENICLNGCGVILDNFVL